MPTLADHRAAQVCPICGVPLDANGDANGDATCALHRCDNPPCARIDHLSLGTKAENNEDMRRKGGDARAQRVGAFARGERHHAAKLRSQDVQRMRDMRAIGMSLTKIGKVVGVAKTTVWKVLNGETWKHVSQKGR